MHPVETSAAALRAAAHNPGCLACGEENPASSKFTVTEISGDQLRGTVTFSTVHQGAPGRVHGGAIATVMDEALGRLAFIEFAEDCVTAHLEIGFEGQAAAPGEYVVTAAVTSREGRKIWVEGTLAGSGQLASARGLFIRVRRDH